MLPVVFERCGGDAVPDALAMIVTGRSETRCKA
jgi:hypothetical protein